jgi:hypothetical protein
VDKSHPGKIPEDLVGINIVAQEANAAAVEEVQLAEAGSETENAAGSPTMPMEKMRTLLALLLKKISTPGRLKKLGFGTRLIDDVLKGSIL